MARRPKRVTPKMQVYRIIESAVETGVNWGWSRAHKYVDNPDEHVMKENMLREIMLALDEVIDFE